MVAVFKSLTLRTAFFFAVGVAGLLVRSLGLQPSLLVAQEPAVLSTNSVRVGVVAFEDFEGEYYSMNSFKLN